MTRYHINPKTGNPNKCSAKEGNCPFKGEDGAEAQHYESRDAAGAGYEAEMEAKAEAARVAKAEEAERNWPSPSAQDVAAVKALGYAVDITRKSVAIRGDDDGRRWDISVRQGEVYASRSFKDSFGSSLAVESNRPFEEGATIERRIEFSDFGTSLSVEEAQKHIRDMEDTIATAPAFVAKVNEVIEVAKNLYGEPKKTYFKDMYAKVQPLPAPETTRDGEEVAYEIDGRGGYYNARIRQPLDWKLRRSSEPTVYNGFDGKANASISIGSANNMDQAAYQKRIEELKDAIITTDAMVKELERRNRTEA